MLHDHTQRFGKEHPTVIQKLWTLAEMTRPLPIAVDYYAQIVQCLNKGSETCHPDAFEPLLIVATEYLKQGRYADALKPCRVLFNSLQSPKTSPKLRDPGFVQTIYERSVHCLREAHSENSTIHDVTMQYRKACISIFGVSSSITIQATKTLAHLCQESKQYEGEAIQPYEELLQIKSSDVEIDRQDIRENLDAIYEQENASLTASKVETMTAKEIQKVFFVRSQRLKSIRSSHGWAHEEALPQMEESVSLRTKQGDSQAVVSMLQEATTQVLSTERSSVKLVAAAKSIASSYIVAGQVQRAKELSHELYRQVITRDNSNTSSFGFNETSRQRLGLDFLARLDYSLQEFEDSSVTMNEIYAAPTAKYMYFEQFRNFIGAETCNLQKTATTVARLHAFLLGRGRQSAASQVVDQYTSFFLKTQGSSLKIDLHQAKVFIETVLEYFSTHTSRDFIRSVAIAAYNRASLLLDSGEYHPPATLKLVFKLGLLIAGRELDSGLTTPVKKYMVSVSAAILRDTLAYFKSHNIELAQLDLAHINSLIKVLDEQHDYHTLAWVLGTLWESRDTHALS
ncbi:hypothetical protein N7523_010601 [Penicillium sp. IBT 18751x]|nr:hypothetical protein N7523_010601 [Penicillium sp. IBT 18751x]